MNSLLVYATNSGSTLTASQIVLEELTNHGLNPVLKTAAETDPQELNAYDLVILSSPSWDFADREGAPHEDFIKFMEQAKDANFEEKKFAIFGLGDSSYTRFCGAVTDLEAFVKEKKGILIVDSLKIDGFYFAQEENTKLLKDWAQKTANYVTSNS